MSSDTPTPEIDMSVEEQQDSAALTTVTDNNRSFGDMGRQALESVESFPSLLGRLFDEYSRPLTLLGGVLLVVILIAIANGVLNVINLIPLVSPTLELIGLSYTGWFVWRYLIYADKRQELAQDFEVLKGRILGRLEE